MASTSTASAVARVPRGRRWVAVAGRPIGEAHVSLGPTWEPDLFAARRLFATALVLSLAAASTPPVLAAPRPAMRRMPLAERDPVDLALRFPARADRSERQPVDVVADVPATAQPAPAPRRTRKPSPRAKPRPAHVTEATPALPAPFGDMSTVVRWAMAQIGKPYRFGATGPAAFDCSGLTMAALAQIGVRLPHDADAQRRYGRAVSRAQAQPGDLVAWPGHVGIYAGSGLVIHAPHTGDHVRLAPIWGSPTFRRLVG